MRILTLLFVFHLIVSGANAQSEPSNVDNFERVYFVIDSSGSMEDVHSILQEAVSDQLVQVRTSSADAEVYISFFGANTTNECFTAPTINRLDEGSETILVPSDGYKQSTPLGEAFRAAIEDTKGHSARVILFSDEEQTPQCGVDICTVAATYLPIEGLSIESVAIGADAEDRDRLGCLFGAQYLSEQSNAIETGSDTSLESKTTNPSEPKGWDEYQLHEQLPFIFGIGLILSSAFFFQLHYGDRALNIEKQIAELNEELPNPYPGEDIKPKVLDDESPPVRDRKEVRLAGLGLAVMITMIFWPRNASALAEYFVAARSVSWLVVNSTFFTGVAILGIAPLLLAGAQYWRHAQARQKFYVVSGNYTLEKRRREAEQLTAAMQTISELKRQIREIDFQPPPEPKRRRRSRTLSILGQQSEVRTVAPKLVDEDRWDQVCDLARQIAQSVNAPEELGQLHDEATRLEKYLKLRGGKTKKLADFILHLVEDKKVKLKSDDWKTLLEAITSQSVTRINGAMAKLISQ